MRSVVSASGESRPPQPSLTSLLVRVFTALVLGYASYNLLTLNLKPIFDTYIPLVAPFKSLAIVGGFLYVFWVSLSHRLCGRGFGVVTALAAVSMCLLTAPWYGVTSPYYYSVFGLASFLAMGILTEYLNGGFGNLACLLINWVSAYAYNVAKVSLIGVLALVPVAFASGLAGDYAARGLYRIVSKWIRF